MGDAARMAQEVQKAACPTTSSMWLIGMNVIYFCFGVTLISLSSWGIHEANSGSGVASGEAAGAARLGAGRRGADDAIRGERRDEALRGNAWRGTMEARRGAARRGRGARNISPRLRGYAWLIGQTKNNVFHLQKLGVSNGTLHRTCQPRQPVWVLHMCWRAPCFYRNECCLA